MKLIRTVRKFLTIKRTTKKRYVLSGGPLNNEVIRLSMSGKNTLIFSLRGQSGRYVKNPTNSKALEWEAYEAI